MAEHAWLKTRLGWLQCQGNEVGLTRLSFAEKPPAGFGHGGAFTRAAIEALERYFDGELSALDAIAVAPAGTKFQKAVWSELRKVRSGELVSYGELAERIGRPRSSRAIGQATAKNPLALVVPCHRVVTSDGSLGGYAWGAWRKAWLLEHEQVPHLQPRARRARSTGAAAPAAHAHSALPLFEKLGDLPCGVRRDVLDPFGSSAGLATGDPTLSLTR